MSTRNKKARPGAGRKRASQKHIAPSSITQNSPTCLLCRRPARLAISLVTEINGAFVAAGVCLPCIERRGGKFSPADFDQIFGRQASPGGSQ